jgi:hypothetical protein
MLREWRCARTHDTAGSRDHGGIRTSGGPEQLRETSTSGTTLRASCNTALFDGHEVDAKAQTDARFTA